jgi:hypothetical protein
MITIQKQHCDERLHIYDVAQVSSHPKVTEKVTAFTIIQPYKRDYENHSINN